MCPWADRQTGKVISTASVIDRATLAVPLCPDDTHASSHGETIPTIRFFGWLVDEDANHLHNIQSIQTERQ